MHGLEVLREEACDLNLRMRRDVRPVLARANEE